MKQRLTRFLAVILALVMVLGIGPQFTAPAHAATEYTYSVHVASWTGDTQLPVVTDLDTNAQIPITFAQDSQQWWVGTFTSTSGLVNARVSHGSDSWRTARNMDFVLTPTYANVYVFWNVVSSTVYAMPNTDGTVNFTVLAWQDPMFLAGDFNSWNSTANKMTQNDSLLSAVTSAKIAADPNNHVYTATINTGYGAQQFKIIRNTTWDSAAGNAIINVAPPVAITSPVINADGTVTFQIDAATAASMGTAGGLNIAGTVPGFADTGWTLTPMTLNGSNIYQFTTAASVPPGTYQYKFVGSNGWYSDPNNPKTIGSDNNSLLIVPGLILSGPGTLAGAGTYQFSAQLVNADGTITANPSPVTWGIGGTAPAGVTINSSTGLLTATAATPNCSIIVTATYGGVTYQITKTYNSSMNTLKVHYYQYPPQSYSGWNIWLWEETPLSGSGSQYNFDSLTPDGNGWVTATIALPGDVTGVGIILRQGNWVSQDPQIDVPISGNTEIWYIDGESTFYTSPPSTGSKVISAFADSTTSLVGALNFNPGINATALTLWNVTDNAPVMDGFFTVSGNSYSATTTATLLAPDKLYQVRYNGSACNVVMRNILDSFASTAADLGVTYGASGSVFKVWAPTATNVQVAIYNTLAQGLSTADYDANGKVKSSKLTQPDSLTPMLRAADSTWTASLEGALAGKFYMFQVTQPDGSVTYAIDPYARSASANGQLGAIVDLSASGTVAPLVPRAGIPAVTNPTDEIVYELSVRDFSISPSSGVPAADQGKFMAFGDTGTTVNGVAGNPATCIDHLKQLGVTTVQIMPSFDFGSVNELGDLSFDAAKAANWGYDPQNYNVPEGSYSTDPTNPNARVQEFKDMVSALHEAGIRVIMDVVYNHTYSIASGPFNNVVPSYYYRTWANGQYSNGSGCGNEVASERAMVRKYIIDSLLYWQSEYGVDGFRFDLMALIDGYTMRDAAAALKAADPDIILYGEPWAAASTPLSQMKNSDGTTGDWQTVEGWQYGYGFGFFNYRTREAIKGDNDGNGNGFVTGGSTESALAADIKASFSGNIISCASETVSYAGAHDNLALWDKMQYCNGVNITAASYAGNPYAGVSSGAAALSNNSVKSDILANGIVLTSQGIPFFQGGDELLRSKGGNSNSYNANDSTNALNYANLLTYGAVNDYYAGLIALRNTHPAFRMSDLAQINGKFTTITAANHIVAYKLSGNAGGDIWNTVYVAYNGGGAAQNVNFGATVPLHVVVNAAAAGVSELETIAAGAVYSLPARSMVVAYDEATIYDPVLTSIALTPATSQIAVAGTQRYVLSYLDQMGNVMTVPGATVTWSSSEPMIAGVSNGLVTGVKIGTATITVTVVAGGQTLSATATVNVIGQRYLVIQYNSLTAGLADVYTGENNWTNTVYTPFGATRFGNYPAVIIPVSASATSCYYIIRTNSDWTTGGTGKDVNADQLVMLNPTDIYTIVLVQPGVPNTTPLPEAVSYLDGETMVFLYHAAGVFPTDTVTVNVGGTIVQMTWNAQNQYFEARVPGTPGTTYPYQFGVNGAYTDDMYNPTSSFTIPAYIVTYDANGGVSGADTTEAVAHNGNPAIPATVTPSRTGYTFSGWATTKTAATADFTTSSVVTADITVYAVWTPVTFPGATYAKVRGTVGGSVVVYVAPTDITGANPQQLTLPVVTTGPNMGNSIVTRVVVSIPGGDAYLAANSGDSFLLHRINRSGRVAQEIKDITLTALGGDLYEALMSCPFSPTQLGPGPNNFYFEVGLASASRDTATYPTDLCQAFTAPICTLEITTVTAYTTVTFDSRGGSAVASQSVVTGTVATKPANPTRANYVFTGWYTDLACTARFSFSTPVSGVTMTLYAGWLAGSFTNVTGSVNGSAVSYNAPVGITGAGPLQQLTLPVAAGVNTTVTKATVSIPGGDAFLAANAGQAFLLHRINRSGRVAQEVGTDITLTALGGDLYTASLPYAFLSTQPGTYYFEVGYTGASRDSVTYPTDVYQAFTNPICRLQVDLVVQ